MFNNHFLNVVPEVIEWRKLLHIPAPLSLPSLCNEIPITQGVVCHLHVNEASSSSSSSFNCIEKSFFSQTVSSIHVLNVSGFV